MLSPSRTAALVAINLVDVGNVIFKISGQTEDVVFKAGEARDHSVGIGLRDMVFICSPVARRPKIHSTTRGQAQGIISASKLRSLFRSIFALCLGSILCVQAILLAHLTVVRLF